MRLRGEQNKVRTSKLYLWIVAGVLLCTVIGIILFNFPETSEEQGQQKPPSQDVISEDDNTVVDITVVENRKEKLPTPTIVVPSEENSEPAVETEQVDKETSSSLSISNETIGDTVNTINNPIIIIKKQDRILELWDGERLYGSYPIGLGWQPIGHKQTEGDGRTPEGSYYVCTRNNVSRFYLSLGLSYPNKEDAIKALEAGLINQGTFEQIETAINRNEQPPWNTAMGGEIMIHGHGSQSDWTAGCIAVDNNIMDILWNSCTLGTKVIIEP